MKRSSAIKIGLVTIAAIAALFWLMRGQVEEERSFGKVERKDLIQRVTIAGTVSPQRRTLVTAPYEGYVKQVFVSVGDHVKAGQPLVSVTQSLQSAEPVFPLRAPYAGTVMHVQKKEGENVKAGDTNEYLMRIDDLSKLFVDATAPEIDRTKLKKGQETVIKASAVLDRSYKGVITELSLAPKGTQGNQQEYPVRIEVLDNDKYLGSGMSVVVDIITDKREKVLTLRHEFVQRDEDSAYFIRTKEGEKRPIKVGMQNEEAFEITEGVTEGLEVQQMDFSTLGLKD
jgi:multidrug efflux pump subunit AcrA (membrane-fusion protein)